MDSQPSVDAIFTTLAFLVFICLFFTAWQAFVVDTVRHRIFEIRNHALLWAHDRERLSDPAYVEFRQAANFAIRHFENSSFLRIIVLSKMFNFSKKPKLVPGYMSDDHFKHQFTRLVNVFILGLVLRSPVALIGVMALLPFALVSVLLNGLDRSPANRVAKKMSRNVEAEIQMAGACAA